MIIVAVGSFSVLILFCFCLLSLFFNRPFYSCVFSACFTVVYSVPWPFYRSEAGGDLVLLQTVLLFMCKSWYSHVNKPVNMIIYI